MMLWLWPNGGAGITKFILRWTVTAVSSVVFIFAHSASLSASAIFPPPQARASLTSLVAILHLSTRCPHFPHQSWSPDSHTCVSFPNHPRQCIYQPLLSSQVLGCQCCFVLLLSIHLNPICTCLPAPFLLICEFPAASVGTCSLNYSGLPAWGPLPCCLHYTDLTGTSFFLLRYFPK